MFTRTGNGAHPISRLREEMDNLFDNFLGEGWNPLSAAWSPLSGLVRGYPPLNVWEDDQNLYAEAELPGLSMEGLEVFVVGNELTVKGERKGCQKESETYHRCERGVGSFQRTIPLPMPINADQVEASLHDGVLTITMPKAEAAKPRKIEVKAK